MHQELSDEQLMVRYQAGCRASGAQLFERYHARLFGYLVRLLGDRTEAEDQLQEVFLKMHQARHSYAGRGKLANWLYRVATRVAYNAIAARQRTGRLLVLDGSVDVADPATTPRETCALGEVNQRLEAAIAQLPADARSVFVLRQFHQLDYAALTEVLGEPEGRLRTRYHRARQQLARSLADLMETQR